MHLISAQKLLLPVAAFYRGYNLQFLHGRLTYIIHFHGKSKIELASSQESLHRMMCHHSNAITASTTLIMIMMTTIYRINGDSLSSVVWWTRSGGDDKSESDAWLGRFFNSSQFVFGGEWWYFVREWNTTRHKLLSHLSIKSDRAREEKWYTRSRSTYTSIFMQEPTLTGRRSWNDGSATSMTLACAVCRRWEIKVNKTVDIFHYILRCCLLLLRNRKIKCLTRDLIVILMTRLSLLS